ncbi:MAG TPA: FtsX-like permease family protein [Candidatus Binataceae bacterium]|nr:FtsX-like permease family protein [Candidatus Binataceae bacterium]
MNSIVKSADGVPRLAVTNRSSLGRGLPDSYYAKVARLPGVVAVNRMTWFGGVYDDPRHQFPSVAIDADNPDLIWPEYALDHRTVQRFKDAKDSAVVGVATMARFGWHVGDLVSLRQPAIPLTLTFRINGTISHGPDLTLFLFHRDYLEDALHGPKTTTMLWVRCASMGDVSRIAGEIEEMFANSSAEVRAETEKAFLAQMVSHYAPLARLVQGIGLSAVVAIALAVLNAASMGVRERTREIAVLKSLGFTSMQIVSETAVENAVLAFAGGAVGIAGAAVMLDQARGFFPTLGPLLSFGLPAPVMVGGLAVAVAIGIAAGIFPTIGVTRLSAVDGLRRVT